MVETIEPLPAFEAGCLRDDCMVGVEESGGEASELPHHAEVGFTVAVVGGRVEDDGVAFAVDGGVGVPEVPVEQCGGDGDAFEVLRQLFDDAFCCGEEFVIMVAVFDELQLAFQPLFAKKFNPIVRPVVDLWSYADGVVHVESEARFFS